MSFFDVIMIVFTGFSGWKIWQGSSSITARMMMYGFLLFILSSVYL